MEKNTIIIQGAMNDEINKIIEEMDIKDKKVIDGYPFFIGNLINQSLIVSLTYMGGNNATLATYIGIKTFNPKYIINIGCAGSHIKDLDYNDIIIGDKIYNVARFKKNEKKSLEKFEYPYKDNTKNDTYIKCDDNLINIALHLKYQEGKILKGNIASSDNWNCNIKDIEEANSLCNSSCEEMESFSAGLVCKMFDIPFITIRVISNNEINNKKFEVSYRIYQKEKLL
jgi:adenosylhomocysteine nucleosidase